MKDKLIQELEEAKLQTSKEWLDGFNKGIDRAIELTETNREEELEKIEDGIPTIPSYVAKEIEKISEIAKGWAFLGYSEYLSGEGAANIKDNKEAYDWARMNKKLFLQLLGGIVYKVSPEVETVDHDPRNIDWGEVKVQKPVEF